jgi:hypothetical protein
MGYIMNAHFMASYLRHRKNVLVKAPQYNDSCPTLKQFWRDNEIFFGIVESVFKVKYATQVFNEPIRTEGHDDGIRLYLKVINELGPDQQTQAWIHQQSLEEKYSRNTVDGIRGFVRRHQAAYGELELLGKRYTERDKADTI